MAHDCLTFFWGDSGDLLLAWLNVIAPEDARHMQRGTWFTLCAVQCEIERATGVVPSAIPARLSGPSPFPDDVEADFRAVADWFLADLTADQYDTLPPDHHVHSVPDWLDTGVAQPGAIELLIGDPLGPVPTPESVLGRIRSALGS